MAPTSPPARRAAPLVVVVGALLLVLSGCGVVRGTVSTVRVLGDRGFGSPQIQPAAGGTVRVTVEKDVEDLDGAAAEAAGVVWAKLPLRVDRLEVTCKNGFGGRGSYQADRDELERRFGAREPTLDEGFDSIEPRSVLLVLGGLALGGLLVVVGVIVLIVVLVRRSRRGRPPGPPGPPPGWGTQPPPPGYRP